MSPLVTGKIRILPDDVSCRIAAGEVIERPASAVKELIDNSLDAASSLITVEIQEGGRRLIRVSDNGTGMHRDDAALACQRFATSKLQTEDDLNRITTLGFRGEALPSIASVSRFTLKTIPSGSSTGIALASEGGDGYLTKDHTGAPGTQVEILDLFFNTPARLKFLKTVSTEFSKISYTVQQAALLHPEVHFRLCHHEHKILDYPVVSTFQDRLVQMYGPTFLERFLSFSNTTGALQVTGFIVSPHHARTTRSPQEIFVNGRPIKNTTITHAIYEGYKSFLPKRKHPQFIVHVQLDPKTVDVNVHPTKREVRFSHADMIHSEILRAVRQSFTASSHVPLAPNHMALESFSGGPTLPETKPTAQSLAVAQVTPPQSILKTTKHIPGHLSLFAQETMVSYPSKDHEFHIIPLGQTHYTYLLGLINQDLYIIDQHTAHERVLFERLLRAFNQNAIAQQSLLITEPIELLPDQGTLVDEWQPLLSKVGIDIDRFGPTAYVVRAIPTILGKVQVGPLILELLDELTEWKSTDSFDTCIQPVLASMACQSAVQAGRIMTLPEISRLLQDWAQENFPMTCPHGRRVAIRHSRDELNTLFKRVSD